MLLPSWGCSHPGRACLYGRTATGLLSYHFWMADTSPGRMARLLGVRDSMMATNLLALAERGPTLVNAHNSHLQRNKSTMRMWEGPVEWWSAGAHLGDATPTPRVSAWYGYSPLDPTHVTDHDGLVFVKDTSRR